METSDIIKLVSPIAIIFVLNLLQILINTKKINRIKQLPMVPISVVFVITSCIFLVYYKELVAKISGMHPILADAGVVILNVLIFLSFLLRKLITRPIVTAICNNNKILSKFAFDYYEYDDNYSFWFVKEKWANFRKVVLAVSIGLSLATGAFLGLTFFFGKGSSTWILAIPSIIIIIINEFYCYINGLTRREFNHLMYGSDVLSQRISNFYKLRELLERMLEEPLLSGQSGNEFLARETPKDILDNWIKEGEPLDQTTANYFLSKDRYKKADIDCVLATRKLMHHKNVIIFNPFYRDLSMYLVIPAVHALISSKKVIVLCGRNNMVEDAMDWIASELEKFSHMRSLWRVAKLTKDVPDCDVGILTFNQLYDTSVLAANDDFFDETDFVIMLEPSALLNTSQTALCILADMLNFEGRKPACCICDRYTDGIVDTMSHILRSEITDVVAMPVPRCSYTSMSWDVDGDFRRQELFDKQTKYLGNGVEIAAIAIKNQVPDVTWYSSTKSPIRDIKWISGQYYSTICRYMNIPCQQKSLYEKVNFVSNLWNSEQTKEQFIIVEDEFDNIFSMMRAFLSRATNQIFVNVLAENYLLRDYMRCNKRLFLSNPNAIPSYVADYARTERNVVLKLILLMTLWPVTESEAIRELHLAGIDTSDAYITIIELIKKYVPLTEKQERSKVIDNLINISTKRKTDDTFIIDSERLFYIPSNLFDEIFAKSLKNAFYIDEDEIDDSDYIDAKMYGHVLQTILPGQFVTYNGKYYQAKYISPQKGVILRRASNLYDGRKYYRQIRKYSIDSKKNYEIVSQKTVIDVEFVEFKSDITVETSGYLELNDNHDLKSAKLIDYTKDSSVDLFTRNYRNKSILRIHIPDSDPKTCYTLCLLMQEAFRSLFPDGWQYIAVVTDIPDEVEGMLTYMTYEVTGDVETGYIYVIEDSDLDLGLLNAVEKNFNKIMEIITEFLDWHFEKMREPAHNDPLSKRIVKGMKEEKKKRNAVLRVLDRIKKLFGKGKKDTTKVEIEEVEKVEKRGVDEKASKSKKPKNAVVKTEGENKPEDNTIDKSIEEKTEVVDTESTENIAPVEQTYSEGEFTVEDNPDAVGVVINNTTETETTTDTGIANVEEALGEDDLAIDINDKKCNDDSDENPDIVALDGTDIFDETGSVLDNWFFDDEFRKRDMVSVVKTKYQLNCYLKFGFEDINDRLDLEKLLKTLRLRGWSNNDLTLARKRELNPEDIVDLKAINHCDFCGLPISGVSFERLNDGRVRCNDCSSTAINKVEDFRDLFFETLEMVEGYFNIKYKVPINVKVTDAKEVNKGAGRIFKPSTEQTSRVLGFARAYKGTYSLVIENGSPRLAATDTIVHEMTHIWQYLNWNRSEIAEYYGMKSDACSAKALDIVYEGMAMWVSVQYLYQIGEFYYAAKQEALAESRSDVYGIGFRLFKEEYPFVKDTSLLSRTPFMSYPPLDDYVVKQAVRADCHEDDKCIC